MLGQWFVILLLVGFIGYGIKAGMQDENLLEKANKIAGTNAGWIPGSIIVVEKITDQEGMTQEESTAILTSSRDKENKIKWNLGKTEVNGKDNIKEFLSKPDTLLDDIPDIEELSPFTANKLEIKYTTTSTVKKINGRACRLFTYNLEENNQTWKGELWINTITGVPVVLNLKAEKPFMEEDVTVEQYEMTIEYSENPVKWYPLKVEEKAELVIKSFVFFNWKGSSESRIEYSDYWKR